MKHCKACHQPLQFKNVAQADFDSWVYKTVRSYLPCACDNEPSGSIKRLYMSYDFSGFEAAKAFESDDDFDSTHTIYEILEQFVAHANRDWFHGLCESYQIYNEKGEIIFNRSKAVA